MIVVIVLASLPLPLAKIVVVVFIASLPFPTSSSPSSIVVDCCRRHCLGLDRTFKYKPGIIPPDIIPLPLSSSSSPLGPVSYLPCPGPGPDIMPPVCRCHHPHDHLLLLRSGGTRTLGAGHHSLAADVVVVVVNAALPQDLHTRHYFMVLVVIVALGSAFALATRVTSGCGSSRDFAAALATAWAVMTATSA